MASDDDLRAKLTTAIKASPNADWLILPGPVDITWTFTNALLPVIREALADAWDEGGTAHAENVAREIYEDADQITNPWRVVTSSLQREKAGA
jgi:hypothetical protein